MSQLLRALAVAIAIAALIDPAVTTSRVHRPVVSLVDAGAGSKMDDARHRETLAQARRWLDRDFAVIPAPFANASATVVVGDQIPMDVDRLTSPLFAVLPDSTATSVELTQVHGPRRISVHGRASVRVRAHVRNARGKTLLITLRGGALMSDRAERPIASNDEYVALSLSHVATTVGTMVLTVSASLVPTSARPQAPNATTGGPRGAASDIAPTARSLADAAATAVVDVHDTPWHVLVVDARPSWMSTFVRRALERDARFTVSSRVVTSRRAASRISTDANRPPPSLESSASVDRYDMILVGAPESLSSGEVGGLERYMRERGGSVVLLLDRASAGPYTRLTGGLRHQSVAVPRIAEVVDNDGSADTVALRISEFATPIRWSADHRALATIRVADAVVWSTAFGAGQLIVSGALNAWRYRDPAVSAFDRFWRTQLGHAAESSPGPLVIETPSRVVAPNERVDVVVTQRDAALARRAVTRVSVSAAVHRSPSAAISDSMASAQAGPVPVPVRLWPDGSPGQFHGILRAPGRDGSYVLQVGADGQTAATPIVVSGTQRSDRPDDRDLLSRWAQARGGEAVSATQLESLAALVRDRVRPVARPVRWHPMRSGWWIVPFAALLGAEWWMRRRRGLP